ncbi:MAG: helix-turn-helix domain-containing protein [Pseudonocardiaceae bacterium]
METDPHAVAMRMFGVALRHFRTQAGLSLRELGTRCHYDYSRLSRMENGEHLGDEALVGTIDQMLHAGGLLKALRSAAQPPSVLAGSDSAALPVGTLHVGDTDSVTVEIRMPDGRSVRMSISRRQLGQLLAAGALPVILPAGVLGLDEADRLTQAIAQASDTQPSRVDPQVIEYFRRMLAEHYTGDKMLGPRQLLRTAMAQLDVLGTLRKQARPPVATPLLRILAQYAEFVGWLQQDGGDLHAAVYWSDRATQWAQSAADHQMVAYLLIRKSNIACLANDATSAIDLAAAAHDVSGGIGPRLRALAAQQEARGWAMIGDNDRCQRQLHTAAELLRTHSGETDLAGPVYLQHYDLDTLEEQVATCYCNVGRAEDAIPILERKIAALPANLHRDRGHRMAKLANAVIATRHPEPDRAAQLGLACLDLARHTGSARISKELHTLHKALLARWPDQANTRTFHDAFTGS